MSEAGTVTINKSNIKR